MIVFKYEVEEGSCAGELNVFLAIPSRGSSQAGIEEARENCRSETEFVTICSSLSEREGRRINKKEQKRIGRSLLSVPRIAPGVLLSKPSIVGRC